MLAVDLPIAFSFVQAGFPSPADDYLEGRLNIHASCEKTRFNRFYPCP